MTRLTRFSPLVSSVLGFDSFFDEFDRLLDLGSAQPLQGGFPPLNVYKEPTGDYVIEVAVAGFKKDDIQVSHDKKKNLLTVSGNNKRRPTDNLLTNEGAPADGVPMTDLTTTVTPPITGRDVSRVTLKQGIATRSFLKTFTIADNLEVGDATLEDGMLTIQLKKIEKPEDKPLLITVK